MIKEAVEALGGTATYRKIITYIREKYRDVNEGTIRCQIVICTVNHPSRIHYPQNQRPRICNDSRYDFLYQIAPGEVTLYDPEKHGTWAIVEEEGELKIQRLDRDRFPEPPTTKPKSPQPPHAEKATENHDNVDRFVKVCSKLDELRFAGTIDWNGLATNIFHNLKLTAPDKLLLFWLCSIIDQFYKYEQIWTTGEKAMLKIVEKQPSKLLDLQDIILDGKVIKVDGDQFILVRDDLKRIQNTFTFLFSYDEVDGSPSTKLVHFLGQLIKKLQGRSGTLKLAHYIDKHLWQGTPYSPINPNISERELMKFLRRPRKRLWMFLMFLRRDPSVMKIFKDALTEVYGEHRGSQLYEAWTSEEKFSTKELELPSDMWNQRLFNALLRNAIPGKISDAKKMARQFARKYDISPTVFDVTFELGANKCSQKECTNCPFGDNQLCNRKEGELCPLTKWLYKYYRKNPDAPQLKCNPQNCPIGQNIGKNLCTRTIDKTFKH